MRAIWLLAAAFALAGCNGHTDEASFTENPNALRCTAKVLGVADTGETINEDPVARLKLRVSPPQGERPFEATIEATVPRLAVPHLGDTLPVVCDPENPGDTELLT
jgi:hypothetical protein